MVTHRGKKSCWAAAQAVLFLCLMFPPSAWSQQAERLLLRTTWIFNPSQAAFFMGKEKGFFKAAGIDLELQDGRGSRKNLQLLAAGKLPIALADSGTAAQFITQGFAGKVIYIYYQMSPMSVIAHEDKRIRSAKDLEGKRLGRVPASSNTALFPAVAKRNSLDLSKVTLVNATWATLATAFLKGEMDAILLHFPDNVPNLRAKGAKVNFLRYSDLGANTVGEGITATASFLKEKASLVRKLLRAVSQSFLYTNDHRDEAVAALKKAAPLTVKDSKVAREILDGYLSLLHTKNTQGKPLGWMAEKDWEDTLQILSKYAGMKNPLPAQRYYTNDWVPSKVTF
ncbi:MAG: ABC transporter substrate-binding protein [Nitrospinota bacterium]